MKYRVLIADDEELVGEYLKRALEGEPWEVCVVRDGEAALKELSKRTYKVALLDMYMPGYSGLEILEIARRKGIQTAIVIITARGSIELAVDTIKASAVEFVTKPIEAEKVRRIVYKLFAQLHPTPNMLAQQLKEYVCENADDPDLSLQSLCRHFRISERYVCLLLKNEIGTPFRTILRRCRVGRAKKLLEETPLDMARIAELSGFRNAKRLAEVFNSEEGWTPTQYRTEHLGATSRTAGRGSRESALADERAISAGEVWRGSA